MMITAAAEPFVQPLAPLFDEVIAAKWRSATACTRATWPSRPWWARREGAWVRRYAELEGADLRASYAYADSHSDLALLRAVGQPGGGVAGRGAAAGGQAAPVADRGVGHGRGDAPGSVPEAGGALR
jgi:Phosphoserine phosphatase